eukprot:UN05465
MFCLTTKKGGVKKDTLNNIMDTKQFVVNHVERAHFSKIFHASHEFASHVCEFSTVGLTPLPSEKIKPPRILESPIQMECELLKVVDLNGDNYGGATIVVGKILQGHVRQP